MKIGIKATPPSRTNKKQIKAHADPALVEAAHLKAEKEGLTLQELIALSVNAAVAEYGRSPFLKVGRDRLVRRRKAPAAVMTDGPDCRSGTRRIAAWFDRKDAEEVAVFAKEVGVSIEYLIQKGLPEVLRRPAAVPAPANIDGVVSEEERKAA